MSNQEVSAYKITKNLTTQLDSCNKYGTQSDGIPEMPESVTKRTVTQNSDGTWSENSITTVQPIKTPLEIRSQQYENKQTIVSDYKIFATPYDEQMYNYNSQINAKKLEIVNIYNSAVSFGCSTTSSTSLGSEDATIIISGVGVGIGSTLYRDQASISRYQNLENNSPNDVFLSSSQELSPSIFGEGYENTISDNTGSVIGPYRTITNNTTGSLIPPVAPEYSSVCAGCAASVLTIAAEISSLRELRNQHLSSTNLIKKDKTGEQVILWGMGQSQIEIDTKKSNLQTSISNVSSFVDDIVLDKLFLFFDAVKDYSIQTKIETSTGINKILGWDSLGSDASNATPSIISPTFDSGDGPSAWFNQYNITGKYFDLKKPYVDGDGSGILSGDVSYSIEAWFKITDDTSLTSNINTGGSNIIGITSTNGIGLQVYKPSGIRLNFGSRGTGSLENTTDLLLNKWYHVVCTREVGVNNRIYINTTLDNTSSISNLTVLPTTNIMRIGFCTSTYIQQYFPGKISVIRMYSKALSSVEVLKNYNAHKDRYI